MNSQTWIGIIIWGIFITGFGLVSDVAAAGQSQVQAQDLVFLIAGGSVTCMIGVIGLMGCMGWIPAVRGAQKSCA